MPVQILNPVKISFRRIRSKQNPTYRQLKLMQNDLFLLPAIRFYLSFLLSTGAAKDKIWVPPFIICDFLILNAWLRKSPISALRGALTPNFLR